VSDYYNENDPYAAAWLRILIKNGLIADGYVDERSIRDIRPMDLWGFNQCHFFGGIGGWPRALRMAGVPGDRPIWTGSCPCQPFSVAGRRKGFNDDRHLWPVWKHLIEECRPATVLGEQTARAPEWLSLVHGDLESMDYAVGLCPIEAASAGAYHFRDRYWFVAHANIKRPQGRRGMEFSPSERTARPSRSDGLPTRDVSDSDDTERRPGQPRGDFDGRQAAGWFQGDGDAPEHGAGDVGHGDSRGGKTREPAAATPGHRDAALAADRHVDYCESIGWGQGWTEPELRRWGPTTAVSSVDGVQIIECPDGKWRRLPPPRVRWLGTRIPARVALLRGIGNAIDIRPATAFIKAALGAIGDVSC
jgi:DNA (cytosine-5)-methyltransferase 1